MTNQRVGDRLRAAARYRPAADVTHRAEREPDAGGQPAIERLHAVRGQTRKQRPGAIVLERVRREAIGGAQRVLAEAAGDEGGPRKCRRAEHQRLQLWPVARDRADRTEVRVTIPPE